jgi:DNA-directed RNA polymerase specialized sigma24 family protein
LRSLAWNVLGNREDVEECLNDTYLAVWNSIPPERPKYLFRCGT